MPWPKGRPRPASSGRQKGSRNKRNTGVEALAAEIIDDPGYIKNLKERALTGTLAPGMEALLFHYRYGKPVDQRNPDDQYFIESLLALVGKHADTPEAREEIRALIEAHAGGHRLRVVA